MTLLFVWYLICGLNIALVIWMFRMLNLPASRSETGDITTEVGYEEDSTGKPLRVDFWSPEEEGEPHVMTASNRLGGLL